MKIKETIMEIIDNYQTKNGVDSKAAEEILQIIYFDLVGNERIRSFKKNPTIYQIGNWLRKPYAIYKLKTNYKKKILPYNKRLQNELHEFLKKDKVKLTLQEKN